MTLPLSAPMLDLLVLSVIAEEDAYGYQIGRIIKRASVRYDERFCVVPDIKAASGKSFCGNV